MVLPVAPSEPTRRELLLGALIGIGFWGPLYYSYNKEPAFLNRVLGPLYYNIVRTKEAPAKYFVEVCPYIIVPVLVAPQPMVG